jgi:hypothetical protein
MAALIFNPYGFRYYLAAPFMITDVGFILGSLIVVYGLLKDRLSILFLGMVVSTLSRQTGLMLLPPVLIWLLNSANGNLKIKKRNMIVWTGICCFSLLIYWKTGKIASRFSGESSNLFHLLWLFYFFWDWVRGSDEHFHIIMGERAVSYLPISHLRLFLIYCLKSIIPFLNSLVIFFVFWFRNQKKKSPKNTYLLLIFSFFICLQPMLSGPYRHDLTRLNSFASFSILLAFAYFLEETKVELVNGKKWLIIFIFTLFIGSLHHKTSLFGVIIWSKDPENFAKFYLFVCTSLMLISFLSIKKSLREKDSKIYA